MKKIFLSLLAIAATIAMTACSNDDDKKNDDTPTEPNELSGTLTETRTLDASIVYHLVGPLIVEDGATLNIPAGTRIEAKKSFNSYILVLMGGKINVNGTATDPVVMTADVENPATGHWGGLVINGKAPVSEGSGETEISKQFAYGGDNAADNSGSIEYLVIEYSGARSSKDVEHNALTLNGVGNGTTIENIFLRNGDDDGIEFFGGTVNVTNLLVVNSSDDMFDFTQGYAGTLTNAYGLWESTFSPRSSDPSGIEADGNLDGDFPSSTLQSNFTVADVTFDLRNAYNGTDATKQMLALMRIRRNATATVTNALVEGTGCVNAIFNFTSADANAATAVSLTNDLTNAALNADNFGSTTYDNVDGDVAGNTGADTSAFDWTGYTF